MRGYLRQGEHAAVISQPGSPIYLHQISDDDWRGIVQIRKYCQKLNIPLHFYDSLDYFKGQRQAFEIPYSQIAETHKMYKNKLNGQQKNI